MTPWYALNLRRGDVNVELTADDPVFMADEMARWLSVMGLPAASQSVSPPKAVPVVPPKPVIPTSLTDRLPAATTPISEPDKATPLKPQSPQTQEPISSFQPSKGIQLPGELIEEPSKAEEEQPSRIQQPSLLASLATEDTGEGSDDALPTTLEDDTDTEIDADTLFESDLQGPEGDSFAFPDEEEPLVAPAPPDASESVDWGDTALADRGQPDPDDDFERVMSTLMDDLTAQPTQVGEDAPVFSSEILDDVDDAPSVGVFRKEGMHGPVAAALPNAADNPNSYKTLCERACAATPEDHLLISAYALATSQGIERFSLSDLNAVIQGAGHDMVTHSILAVAVDKGLLTAVADMSADATQYELTRHGRTTVEMFI